MCCWRKRWDSKKALKPAWVLTLAGNSRVNAPKNAPKMNSLLALVRPERALPGGALATGDPAPRFWIRVLRRRLRRTHAARTDGPMSAGTGQLADQLPAGVFDSVRMPPPHYLPVRLSVRKWFSHPLVSRRGLNYPCFLSPGKNLDPGGGAGRALVRVIGLRAHQPARWAAGGRRCRKRSTTCQHPQSTDRILNNQECRYARPPAKPSFFSGTLGQHKKTNIDCI